MAELTTEGTLGIETMREAELVANGVRAQLFNLQELASYLEERGTLGAQEFSYCQAKLREVVKHLKRIERLTAAELSDE